jgi:IrrE N-terminal-like domain
VRRDYKVPFRTKESLVQSALACREFAGNQNLARFNVVEFVERVLPRILEKRKKGQLKLKFFDMVERQAPAYVDFDESMTLYVDREIWELATLGDPYAKFVIAHEVGHIILHDHYAQAFSDDPNDQIKFAQDEESAEWQANMFASYFLVTPQVLKAFRDPQDLSRSCEVLQALANERFEEEEEARRRSERCARAKGYTGDPCTNCWNFTLVVSGLSTRCDICGETKRNL